MIDIDALPLLNREEAKIMSEIRLNKKIKSLIFKFGQSGPRSTFVCNSVITNNGTWLDQMKEKRDESSEVIKESLKKFDELYLKLKELREIDPKKIAKTNCYPTYRRSVPCWLDFNDEVFARVADEN